MVMTMATVAYSAIRSGAYWANIMASMDGRGAEGFENYVFRTDVDF